MGATLLLVGLASAAVTAPLFDRILTHHLALTCRVLCPILGALWLSLIWASKSQSEKFQSHPSLLLFLLFNVLRH